MARSLLAETQAKLWDSWINNIPAHFSKAGLSICHSHSEAPLPLYRKPWNEDNLLGWAALGDAIKDDKDRAWFKDMHLQAATNASKGWYVDWELVVCTGRKGSERS